MLEQLSSRLILAMAMVKKPKPPTPTCRDIYRAAARKTLIVALARKLFSLGPSRVNGTVSEGVRCGEHEPLGI
jgi:hypothetical protein